MISWHFEGTWTLREDNKDLYNIGMYTNGFDVTSRQTRIATQFGSTEWEKIVDFESLDAARDWCNRQVMGKKKK